MSVADATALVEGLLTTMGLETGALFEAEAVPSRGAG